MFDCLVFVLTIWRTYRVVRPRFYTMMGSVDGLMELIFRDGEFLNPKMQRGYFPF